jgi:hypothetical protein
LDGESAFLLDDLDVESVLLVASDSDKLFHAAGVQCLPLTPKKVSMSSVDGTFQPVPLLLPS